MNFTHKMVKKLFLIVNGNEHKKKKKYIDWFTNRLKSYPEQRLVNYLIALRQHIPLLKKEEKRVISYFLGFGWKYRPDEKLIARICELKVMEVTSDALVARFDTIMDKADKFLQRNWFYCLGARIKLADLINADTYLKLGENNFRRILKIVNNFVIKLGDAGTPYMLTVTAPGFLHSPQCGLDVRLANNYMQAGWKRFRALFAKRRYFLAGVRSVELHKDFTPHFHFLIFSSASKSEITNLAKKCWLPADSKEEYGAKEHRFALDAIDGDAGKPFMYVLKYLLKNFCHNSSEVSKSIKENRSVFGGVRIRAISLFGLRKYVSLLRFAYRFNVKNIDWDRWFDYELKFKHWCPCWMQEVKEYVLCFMDKPVFGLSKLRFWNCSMDGGKLSEDIGLDLFIVPCII